MKIIGILTNIFNRTIDLTVILAGTLLIFSMLSISMGVASRYLLGRPMGWVVEISEYSLVYITFLIAAWVLKREGHVKVDILVERLKPKPQSVLNIVGSMLAIISCGIIFWYSLRVTWESFQKGYFSPTILEIPKWPVQAVIPLGSFLLFVQFIRRSYREFEKLLNRPDDR